MAQGAVKVNDDNFKTEVEQAKGVVLVDMSAEWCPPCKRLAPIIDELAGDLAGKAKICKLDVNESGETASRFNVFNVPTMILFKNGKEVERMVGFSSKENIASVISRLTG